MGQRREGSNKLGQVFGPPSQAPRLRKLLRLYYTKSNLATRRHGLGGVLWREGICGACVLIVAKAEGVGWLCAGGSR